MYMYMYTVHEFCLRWAVFGTVPANKRGALPAGLPLESSRISCAHSIPVASSVRTPVATVSPHRCSDMSFSSQYELKEDLGK